MTAANTIDMDLEQQLWKNLIPSAWSDSINKQSSFEGLYDDTRKEIADMVDRFHHDVVIEVGCGTGEVLGHLGVSCDRIGIDINESFISTCQERYGSQSQAPSFEVQDACKLYDYWQRADYMNKYKNPVVLCCNNTLMIMPEDMRDKVVEQMRLVAGDGRCLITFWNGCYFTHGILTFYSKNPNLCGSFNMNIRDHVDMKNRTLTTPVGYSSKWLLTEEVVRYFNSLLIAVDVIAHEHIEAALSEGRVHVHERGLGIFVWINGLTTESANAKDYYDSNDAQAFYSCVWGEDTIHIGRYDMVYADAKLKASSVAEHVRYAQDLQEAELLKHITSRLGNAPIRCVDFGCGYGGLLRLMGREGMLWSGFGVDVSEGMVKGTMRQNSKESREVQGLLCVKRESYLNTSADDESADLVVSMDAFLHVGPELQTEVVKEAYRVLRPGGWFIFTDIMQRPDAPADLLSPLHKRIGLSSFGSVGHYYKAGAAVGFGNMSFEDNSVNVQYHYGTILNVFEEMSSRSNSSERMNVSEGFREHMISGLEKWRDLSPRTLQWGIISMQKLSKVALPMPEVPPCRY